MEEAKKLLECKFPPNPNKAAITEAKLAGKSCLNTTKERRGSNGSVTFDDVANSKLASAADTSKAEKIVQDRKSFHDDLTLSMNDAMVISRPQSSSHSNTHTLTEQFHTFSKCFR